MQAKYRENAKSAKSNDFGFAALDLAQSGLTDVSRVGESQRKKLAIRIHKFHAPVHGLGRGVISSGFS